MAEKALRVREQDTFIQMDAEDEQQILREMEGEIVKDLYYEVNGKRGLSYAGVNHMSFKIGGIKILPESVKIEYDEKTDEYVGYAVALNEKYNLTRAGVSVQPKMMEVYDRDERGQRIPDGKGGFKNHLEYDKFARVKALSKAQRNAVKAVIPETLIAAYLDYFYKLRQGVRGSQPRDEGPKGEKDPRRQVESEAEVKSPESPAFNPRKFDNPNPPPNGNEDDPVNLWQSIFREAGFTETEVSDNVEIEVIDDYHVAIHQKASYMPENLWRRFMQVVSDQRGVWNKDKRQWEGPC
jgi:hypothetical protein